MSGIGWEAEGFVFKSMGDAEFYAVAVSAYRFLTLTMEGVKREMKKAEAEGDLRKSEFFTSTLREAAEELCYIGREMADLSKRGVSLKLLEGR